MDTARKRILHFIEHQSIKPSDFLKETGLKKGFIDRSHENSGASDIHLSKILEHYPRLSAKWLLTGKGEMLKINDKRIEVIQDTKDQYIIELQKDKIGRLEKEIAELKKAKEPHSGYRNVAEP